MFTLLHFLKMSYARRQYHRHAQTPSHSLYQHLKDYLNVWAGRLTCLTCLPNRYAQLIGKAYLCESCKAFAEEVHTREYKPTLRDMKTLFEEIRAGGFSYLQPKGKPQAIALVVVNSDCDSLAVIGGGALLSFLVGWRRLVKRGYVVMPYVVHQDVDLAYYAELALSERGRALGFEELHHLEIISHGIGGNVCLSVRNEASVPLAKGGSILFNSCESIHSTQEMSKVQPEAWVFASDTITGFAEPQVKVTPQGPRVRSVRFSLILSQKMKTFLAGQELTKGEIL